jgi:hypothetical protein
MSELLPIISGKQLGDLLRRYPLMGPLACTPESMTVWHYDEEGNECKIVSVRGEVMRYEERPRRTQP